MHNKEKRLSSSFLSRFRVTKCHWLFLAISLVLGAGLCSSRGEDKAEAPAPILTEIGKFYSALESNPQQRCQYSWDLNVLYYDPDWKLLWVENNGRSDFLPSGDTKLPIQSGQRVRFEGELLPADGLSVKNARLTILPRATEIQPMDTRGLIADRAKFQNRLVSVEANVEVQNEPDSTHLQLDSRVEGCRVIIKIRIDPKDPRPQLEGALVSAIGVYASETTSASKTPSITLWVPRLENLRVIKSFVSTPALAQEDLSAKEPSKQSGNDESKAAPPAQAEKDGSPAILSDIGRFYVALTNEPNKRHHYSWILDVFFYDPEWKLMWVENNGKSDFIPPGDDPLPIKSGQRARFEGDIVPAGGLSLKGARVTPLPLRTDIHPLDTRGAVGDNARFHNRLVTLEAVIDKQSESDPTHLMLEASAEEIHVVIHVLIDPKTPSPQLEGALVSVTGIYAGVTDLSGKLTSVSVWVPQLDSLKVLSWLSKDPRFERPPISIEEIPNQAPGKMVRVVGIVHSIDNTGASLTLRDATGQVLVSTAQTRNIVPGMRLEALGTCEATGVQSRLRNAVVRPSNQGIPSIGRRPSEQRSKLRLADEVLALKPDEANKGLPVQLFGIITWADPEGRSLFVQDVTRGVEVLVPNKLQFIPQEPRSVSIKGITKHGSFAPVVVATDIIWNNPLGTPVPRAVTLEQMMMGDEHGRWVEINGYLSNISRQTGCTRLDLTAPTGEFTAELPPDTELSNMLGAVIRLRGVCTAVANDRRQLVAVKLLVPSPSFIQVVEAAQHDPFAAEESSIAGLREFAPSQSFLRRVRTEGYVLLHTPERYIAIQDGNEALLVLCRQAIKLVPGDYIEVVGIPGREGARVVLREASCRISRRGKEPAPLILSNPTAPDDNIDGHLVRVEGTIAGIQKRANEISFTLQSGERLFEATLTSDLNSKTHSRIGSLVSLVGVYRTRHDEYRQPIDFTILMRSEGDFTILRPPPLLTVKLALSVVAVLVLLVLGGITWVMMLRQRVKKQTELIREHFKRETRLEAELQRAARIESVGLLAGGIAHDFNNLLTVILGNISLALSENAVADVAGQVLKDAKTGVLRARDLTQKLLTFAKGGDPFLATIRLSDLTKETIVFSLHGSKINSTYTFSPDLWDIDADRTQLGQVIHNLTINAIQAMPTGGTIHVSLENTVVAERSIGNLAQGRYVLLTFSDTGAGIAHELLPKVFDPYFTTKTLGNGLGLATAYSIVKKHLGHIDVESEVGVGTSFRVWLPAAKKPSITIPAVQVTQETVADPKALSARVLVMDDEENIRLLCNKALSRMGLEVTTTSSGTEAVQEFSLAWESGRPYQLVIFDLTVPGGMGGKDALEKVHKIDPRVRAIVSSGYSNDPVMAEYRRYGFDAVVPKPWEIDQMVNTVRQVLTRKG